MKLITEKIEDVECITEEVNGKKKLYIQGVFLQSEIKNRNGRMYPFRVMEAAVNRYKKDHIENRTALGELGHPGNNEVSIDYKNVSHKILSLEQNGNNFIGKAEVLDTPVGNIVKTLHEANVKLAVSSRGLGSIQEAPDCNIVKDDFMLCTAADIVSDPSAPDAFVDGIYEGKDWVWDNGILKEQAVQPYANKVKKSRTDKEVLKIFEDYLSTLINKKII